MPDNHRKVALVTGSATGIGRACAIRFAEMGYDVVVNYSRSEAEARETLRLVEECQVRGLLVQCDVGNDTDVRGMIQKVEDEFGRLDVLVNNAATTWFIEGVPKVNQRARMDSGTGSNVLLAARSAGEARLGQG